MGIFSKSNQSDINKSRDANITAMIMTTAQVLSKAISDRTLNSKTLKDYEYIWSPFWVAGLRFSSPENIDFTSKLLMSQNYSEDCKKVISAVLANPDEKLFRKFRESHERLREDISKNIYDLAFGPYLTNESNIDVQNIFESIFQMYSHYFNQLIKNPSPIVDDFVYIASSAVAVAARDINSQLNKQTLDQIKLSHGATQAVFSFAGVIFEAREGE